jgi:hypothetical protein
MSTRAAAFVLVVLLGWSACSRRTPEAPPPPAPPAPPAAAEPPAEPPAAPAVPPPPSSVLRDKLLGAQDLESFRALLAETLVVSSRLPKAAKPTTLVAARLDQRQFDARVRPLLPREPDPAEGEGEDFECDDARATCVFRDAAGNATTYVFTAQAGEPRLHEIRKEPPPRTP